MNTVAGTLRLTRLAARRDAVTLLVWIGGMAAFLTLTSAMFVRSLVTYQDRLEQAKVATNTIGLRMLGLTSGPTVGGAVLVRDYVFLAVLAALMSALTVLRHTRQSEELGRAEVLGATVVGRYADLAAAVLVGVAANVVLAACLGLAMVGNGLPVAGSLAAGAAVAAVGLLFVGVGAVAAQLASTMRGAIGLTTGVLAAAFLLAGVGNMLGDADARHVSVGSAWPAWLSPIGWGQQVRPFGGDHWSLLALFLPPLLVLLGAAALLVGRRDVGAGLWPQRRGTASAGRGLLSPEGLVLRLQRGPLIGWLVGLVVFGLIFGTMTQQIEDGGTRTRDYYSRVAGAGRILEAFESEMVQFAALMAAVYAVQVTLRLRSDESGGTAEPVLAAGVSRRRWVIAHVVNAAGGTGLLLTAYAVSLALAAGLVVGDPARQVRNLLGAALAEAPAVLLIGAAVLALVGLLPRLAAPLAWTLVVLAIMLGPMFGAALGLPSWVLDLSPFSHVPPYPATDLTATPLLVGGLAVALALLGLAAIRRRDLRLTA